MAYDPVYWKNRDVLNEFLCRKSDSTAPSLSVQFDIDTCLVRLRRDKANIVRCSFGAAAQAVIQAVLVNTDESMDLPDPNLFPDAIEDYDRVVQSRDECLEQSQRTTTTKTPMRETAKATTAASSAVMDSRATVSRAVLCAAASMAFEELTPDFEGQPKLDALNVPQGSSVNMGAVLLQAKTLGQRAIEVCNNAVSRSTQRLEYERNLKPLEEFVEVDNPFAWKEDEDKDMPTPITAVAYEPNQNSATSDWMKALPRLQQILNKGIGHAVICDPQWNARHGRISQFMHAMAKDENYFGPHLIVTTTPNVTKFCQEFQQLQFPMRLVPEPDSGLRVLNYSGTSDQRRKLRKVHFAAQLGMPGSSYHVLVASYQDFLEDYIDFCQVPFQIAVIDGGFSWLSAAQSDPNSQLAMLWEQGIFSRSDSHIGMAYASEWEFGQKDPSSKHACMGITCRHRILTTPLLALSQKQRSLTLPGLLNCLLPHVTEVVREEWDRSRITHDQPAMNHLKQLITRCIVVHAQGDLHELAIESMEGNLDCEEEYDGVRPPNFFTDDEFVSDGKVSNSRRTALNHLGPWLRYELGISNFGAIVDMMKESNICGHVCDEIMPMSVTTSSGASGAITGSLAYKLGVRCGRSFGSEQGLRQHIAAMHAPPGTWLCRTCSSDCGTSQARTHHERSCGQPQEEQPQHGPASVVGKKAKGNKTPAQPKDKDSDGSFRIPGFRGVWVNPAGKHFVKVGKERLMEAGELLFFDTPENAAQKHDEAAKDSNGTELNFKSDGSRIKYDDNAAASAAGRGLEMLGGGSSSVVPALSVINIKDLPKDVKPLLRDPRQTSRTGGNSKRHVYAYRGVCRQARKGHDRWQSQISFGGTNHYLGTFDSEWDAAAVYAWAHLILYGEEATKKAQTEGEEAAAAYEREKAAIAAGEALPTQPKPAKKEKKALGKRKKKSEDDGSEPKKAKPGPRAKPGPKPGSRDSGLGVVLSKSVAKASVLGPRKVFEDRSDEDMMKLVSGRILAVHKLEYAVCETDAPADVEPYLRPNAPVNTFLQTKPRGGAMLLGLSSNIFGWMPDIFASTCDFESDEHESWALSAMTEEYETAGHNETFRSVIQGSVCVIGRASRDTERACEQLTIGPPVVGGTLGDIDCHIGGTYNSCGESAATIQHLRTNESDFQIMANNNEDMVTLNGKRITVDMGPFPLFNEDVCTVGARVFVFLLPSDT